MTVPNWDGVDAEPSSYAELLIGAVQQHGDRPAMRLLGGSTSTSRHLTWAEVGAIVAEAGRWLAERGAGAGGAGGGGGRLSLVGEPSPGYHVLEMAALVSGWSVNPVYCDAAPGEIDRVLAAVGPQVVAADRHWADAAGQPFAGGVPGAEFVDLAAQFEAWESAASARAASGRAASGRAASGRAASGRAGVSVAAESAAAVVAELRAVAAPPQLEGASLLLQSSGTTGPAQVIDLPVAAILHAAWAVRHVVDPRPRLLAFLPAAHVSHQLINVFAATLLGGEICFGGGGGIGRDAEDLVADLRRSRPTVLFGSPLLFAEVVNEARRTLERRALGRAIWRRLQRETQRSLDRGVIVRDRETLLGRVIGWQLRRSLGLQHAREMFSGTSPLDANVHAFLGVVGWFVRNTYGLSECGGAATISGPDRMTPGELGAPVDGMEVEVDADGQLLLRGPSLMRGYLNRQAIAFGDWLGTGDVVRPGPRRALCFYTRMSSVIRTPDGPTTLDEIEGAATRVLPETTAVAVAEGDRAVSLFLFTGEDITDPEFPRAVLRAFHEGEIAAFRCVQRLAVVPGAPSPARHEIGPTGKARRWMIHEHWKEYLLETAPAGR